MAVSRGRDGPKVVLAAVTVVVLGCTSSPARTGGDATAAPPAGVVVGDVPVWYDDAGLHRGDVVEDTAVPILDPETDNGALALVRAGALYRDPFNDDVWFHPWGGEPRVVGHDSWAGPGGDPAGDVAAWFDDNELVVYDTARGRELSRTDEMPVHLWANNDFGQGNGFLHVSSREVVWRFFDDVQRLDVATGSSSTLWRAPSQFRDRTLVDVHDTVLVRGSWKDGELTVEVGEGEGTRVDSTYGRLSPDGSFLLSSLAVSGVRSGGQWELPAGSHGYRTVAWSYGDVALVLIQRRRGLGPLLTCDAVARTCDRLSYEGAVLLPTS